MFIMPFELIASVHSACSLLTLVTVSISVDGIVAVPSYISNPTVHCLA